MTRSAWPLWAALLAALSLSGCATAPSPGHQAVAAPEVLRSSVRLQKEYLLTEGDQIEVSVWRNQEVSRTVMIRPDGHISLPLLQDVKAAGLSPRELADQLRTALSGRLVKPEINVIPVNIRQPTVYVLGDARNPGAFPLRSSATAAQAIALAGGVLRSGSEENITIIRLSAEGYLEAIPLASSGAGRGPSPYLQMAATPLKADDIVFIPESGRGAVVRAINDLLAPFTIYLNYRLLEKID